ncbi:unnamed protein product [Sphenostylis stenocarpa]|uniref:Uncharacterized protein n=1 Tax=Sphenostylis stenocarpa TaxID=92480 RepID=A0AA86SKD8_9FABA|nr:unnamed protein product [Sphenostylis stenocarpa]
MGNTHTSNYSEWFPLDDSSAILIRKTKFGRGVETWTAEYNTFGRRNCELELTKTNGDYRHEQDLTISIHDHASDHAKDYTDFQMKVSVKNDLLLGDISVDGPASMLRLPQCKIPNAQGGVLKSSSFLYGSDTDRKGLLVMSRARTHDDDKELPYMITVKHYFLDVCCSHGASLEAKVRSNSGDGGLSVEIEKPSKHPKRELLKIFDDVKGNGWWPDPSSSDWAMDKNPANPNPFPSYIMRGLIGNGGYVKGNGNGSINIVHKHYYGSGRKKKTFEPFGKQ